MNKDSKKLVKECIELIEENLECLLELEDGTGEIAKVVEEGFTCNTGEGMPTFEIKLVPTNIRDSLRLS